MPHAQRAAAAVTDFSHIRGTTVRGRGGSSFDQSGTKQTWHQERVHMKTCVKLILAAATATVVLGAAASTASARRIEVSEQRFHQVWTSITFVGEFASVKCPMTIEGSFHSKTTSKVIGQLIGYITRVTLIGGACTSGHATALTEILPWHITYEGFGGILPRITEIHILLIGAAFRFELLGGSCLVQTSTTEPSEDWIFIEPNTGQVRNLFPNPNRLIRTSAGCLAGATGRFEGTSEVFAGGQESGTTRITVRLVQ